MLHEDDTYTLSLDVGDATRTGTTVTFGEQKLSLSKFFFQIPEVPSEFTRPGAEYWVSRFLVRTRTNQSHQIVMAHL